MKIAIDISQIIYQTGVSWYTKNLVEHILKQDEDNSYTLFGGSLRRLSDLKIISKSFSGNFKTKFLPIPPMLASILWNDLHLLKIESLLGKIDLFHSSDWTQPPTNATKITTVHDLTPICNMGGFKSNWRDISRVHTKRLNWVKKEVDKIIAVSETTKKDIIELLGIEEEKIQVIYEAPDTIYVPQPQIKVGGYLSKMGITNEYILSVGTGKRKNLEKAYSAYLDIRKDYPNLKYVIAGNNPPDFKGNYIFIQSPSNYDLSLLYSGAKVFLYPSLYEGFGLPILEAFGCGTPVVTSNISSMKEIAANAAILVDPTSSKSIDEGIMEAINNSDSCIKRGCERVKDFSWEKAAKETISLYEKFK